MPGPSRSIFSTLSIALVCGSCSSTRAPGAKSLSQHATSIHWASGYSEPQAALVDTLLQQAVAAGVLGRAPVEGEISAFSSSSDGGRLLFVTADTNRQIVLYALGGKVTRPLSPAFFAGVADDPYAFQEVDIRDFDGDGAADLEFCTWPTDSGPPELTIVGYVDQAWYKVTPHFQPVPCPPGGAP
jgi:hypothetical protein